MTDNAPKQQLPLENRSPFVGWTGIEISERGNGQAKAQLEIQPDFLNSVEIVHGGIFTALLDTVAGVALATAADPKTYFVTSDLTCHYLRPAKSGILTCTATVSQRGRSAALVEAFVEHNGKRCCQGTIRFAIRPVTPDGPPPQA